MRFCTCRGQFIWKCVDSAVLQLVSLRAISRYAAEPLRRYAPAPRTRYAGFPLRRYAPHGRGRYARSPLRRYAGLVAW